MPASTIGNINFTPDLSRCYLWQYDKATAMQTLLNGEVNFFNVSVGEFWNDWLTYIFNIDTADTDLSPATVGFGLSLWGILLGVQWGTYLDNGVQTPISADMYRRMLKARFFCFRSNGSVADINTYLQIVFDGKPVFCRDNFDMTITILSYVELTAEELAVLLSPGFLPIPAGVLSNIITVAPDEILGFDGSELQTLDNGIFVSFNN